MKKTVTFDERVRVRQMGVTVDEHRKELSSPPSIIVDGHAEGVCKSMGTPHRMRSGGNHTNVENMAVWLPYLFIGGGIMCTVVIILLYVRAKKPEKNNTGS